MSVVVLVGVPQISVSIDSRSTGNSPNNSASALRTSQVAILRTRWNDTGTGKLSTVHFVHHQCFEAIREGVDIVDPSCPAPHRINRDSEPTVKHQAEGKDSRRYHCLV